MSHRSSPGEMILIKDNQITAAGDVAAAVRQAREPAPAELRHMVELVSGRARLEVSDNITPENIVVVAVIGVHIITARK